MKKFKDLKEGDIIYYYNHTKLFPQKITKFEIKESVNKYKDWWGHTRTQISKTGYIKCNKSLSENTIDEEILNKSQAYLGSLLKFSCREAAEKYIKQLKSKAKQKLNKAQTIVNKYSNLMTQYGFSDN
jgi:hypothetical protein